MKIINILVIALLCSCDSKTQENVPIYSAGALKNIMHQGDLRSTANLDTLSIKGIYAVGALDSLSGEILIMNGIPYISTVVDQEDTVYQNASADAVLVVHTRVSQWLDVDWSGVDLEEELKEVFSENGIAEPFPFILEGSFPQLEYHVINYDPMKDDLSDHKKEAFKSNLANKEVTVLGFYSTQHKGVFTHHDSNVHMHVIDNSMTKMGHVDAIDLNGADFKLKIPQL